MSQSTIIPNQFTWSQTDTKIKILFNIDYIIFAWQASTCKGPCPPMDGTRINATIQKNQFEINSYQFTLPIFEGKFKKLILPDESTWVFLPAKGIELTLIKRDEGIPWDSPFEWYEKEVYFKIYKMVNSIEVMDNTPEIIILRLQMGEENFEKNRMKFFHDMNRPYERSFEYMRNGCKLNHLIKLQSDFTKCINKKYLNKDGARYVDNFMQIKWSAFSASHLKYMTPMFLTNLKFQVNLGGYVLVKAATNSQIIFEKHELVVSDSKKQGVKLTILNLSQDITIQEGTWIIIKEPFLHFSICHITAITVDNLDDIIFQADKKMFEREPVKFPQNLNGDTKQRILEIENQQVQGLILSSDLRKLTVTFMAFEWNLQKLTDQNNVIFVERENEWVEAVIKQEEQIGDNCYEITFVEAVKSELFIECVKSLTDKNPGNTLKLWRPTSFNLESIAQFLVYKSEISFEGIKQFTQDSLKLKSTDEVLSFWKDKKEKIIKKVGLFSQKERPKKDNKKNKNKIAIKHKQEAVSRQIEEILMAYEQIKANGRIYPYEKQADREQIVYKSLDNKGRDLAVDLFDSQNMVRRLVNEPDKEISETALNYLVEYGQMLKSGGNVKTKEEFSQEILENKVKSEDKEFDLRRITRALELIELPVSSDKVFSIQRAQELRLRELKMKTQKQEIEKAIVESEDDPLFFSEFKEMEEIFSEFGDQAFNEMKSMFGKEIYHEELADEDDEIIGIGDLQEQFLELKSEGNGENFSEILENKPEKNYNQRLIEVKNGPKRINILDLEEENESYQENIGIQNEKIFKGNNQIITSKQLANSQSSSLAYDQIIFKNSSSKKSQKTPSICSEKRKRVALKKIETNNEGSEFIYPTVAKKQSSSSKNNNSDLFSDTFTVRSRESNQLQNNHWETRLLNRFGMNASSTQIKKYILEQVKQVLNDEESTLTQSVKHSDRYLLIDPSTEMHFVLKQSKSTKTNKTVYIPITVLSKEMKFS